MYTRRKMASIQAYCLRTSLFRRKGTVFRSIFNDDEDLSFLQEIYHSDFLVSLRKAIHPTILPGI